MVIKREDVTEPIEWTEQYLVEVLGIDPIEADFFVAINNGEITGDIVEKQRPLVLLPSPEIKQVERDTTLRAASSRIPMWVNRYTEVVNTAKTMAGADRKLKWVLGPTEHCSSCLKLAGKVKRGSFWQASGIQPQSSSLACGGFNCKCSLQPTTDRASAGRLPSIP
jgi:hypothetical protein